VENTEVTLENLQKDIRLNVVDIADFNDRVVGAYNAGTAEKGLEADDQLARSVIPGGTGALRDFSYISTDIPCSLPRTVSAAWSASLSVRILRSWVRSLSLPYSINS
jgi:hypothetical protein